MGLLVFGNLLVWYVVAHETRHGILTVTYLDVGQGDATFIEGPTGIQVLIDGGKGKKVLSELGKVLPFYDKSIDVVIATHPDQDHIEGLIGVEERYKTLVFIEPNLITDKPFQIALLETVRNRNVQGGGVKELSAWAGQEIDLGLGATLTILFPDLDVSAWQDITNNASVVAILRYGSTSFLFTGDSPIAIENRLIKEYGSQLDVDVLKAGHHGSRTSSGPEYLAITSPTFAIISSGKDNSYGHPHKEVLDNLATVGARVMRTDEQSTITVKSDGEIIVLEE